MPSPDTVTVRLPKDVHQQAKLAATKAGISLQGWIAASASRALGEEGEDLNFRVPYAEEYHRLPQNLRKLVRDFVEFLTLADREHIKHLERHVEALVSILRRVDPQFLREFEKIDTKNNPDELK